MKVTIAAYQMKIIPFDLKKNAEKIHHAFKKSYDRKANFLVLPEECWVGASYQEKKTNEVANFVKEHVSALCKKYHLYCVAGSFIE